MYLVMRFEGPVLPYEGVAKVADLPEHGLHQCGA